ncbi:hypothetical protein Sa4125_14900 [Aureimonas sp. SA4125]|uniref:TylF/MycF/NovP-related O-methyltransferase n=1 Tax=Aureimonas sp. SA4125 TaxID=2826993 RepID=UPI001CC46C1F|nr:TylF/MycF/NovP-related O-methyltransferase [Aureimonas sp. SA4125]BDA83948.1 hypothetical protein Sa4125_14900 [Aureimonas sp. SA4125]
MNLLKRLVRRSVESRGFDIVPQRRVRDLLDKETAYTALLSVPPAVAEPVAQPAHAAVPSEPVVEEVAPVVAPPPISPVAAEPAAPEPEPEYDHQAASAHYQKELGLADMDEAFPPIYTRCRSYSMTSPDRMYSLFKAVEYIEKAGIPGDIVECGVWRGGSMMVAAEALQLFGGERTIHLFDTYEGLPEPSAEDVDIWGHDAKKWWETKKVSEEASDWARAHLDEVKENMRRTGYPEERLRYVKGMVETTIPQHAPEQISILRLDTDWYASTVHEMEHLFPRLVPNGILIIDDYGHFKGAKQAIDEYLQAHNVPIMLMRVDYTGRIAIKTHG